MQHGKTIKIQKLAKAGYDRSTAWQDQHSIACQIEAKDDKGNG